MSNDDLAAFREEMQRRGVYKRGEPRLMTPQERRDRALRRNSVSNIVAKEAVADLASCSVKRLAWAFGCAKPDSPTESTLYRALVDKVAAILKAREP